MPSLELTYITSVSPSPGDLLNLLQSAKCCLFYYKVTIAMGDGELMKQILLSSDVKWVLGEIWRHMKLQIVCLKIFFPTLYNITFKVKWLLLQTSLALLSSKEKKKRFEFKGRGQNYSSIHALVSLFYSSNASFHQQLGMSAQSN